MRLEGLPTGTIEVIRSDGSLDPLSPYELLIAEVARWICTSHSIPDDLYGLAANEPGTAAPRGTLNLAFFSRPKVVGNAVRRIRKPNR